jgi:hypothetical protein
MTYDDEVTYNLEKVDFWKDGDPEITDDVRNILTKYSGVPEEELIPHIRRVVRPYTSMSFPNRHPY